MSLTPDIRLDSCDNGMTMVWQLYNNGMTIVWQCHDNGMTMLWQWYNNVMTMLWQCYDNGMTMVWQCISLVHDSLVINQEIFLYFPKRFWMFVSELFKNKG